MADLKSFINTSSNRIKSAMGVPVDRIKTIQGSKLNYSDEAKALFARMTTVPTSTRKALIDKTITDLKTSGVWDKLDALWIMAAHESPTALLNWIKNDYNLTLQGTTPPTFVTDKGFTGDGISGYINTNYNPTTLGLNYTRNSALFGIATPTQLGAGAYSNGAAISSKICFINPLVVGELTLRAAVNSSSSANTLSVITTRGYSFGNRISSSVVNVTRNKTKKARSHTSVLPPNGNLYLGAYNDGSAAADFNVLQYSFACVGASLLDTEIESFVDIIEYYMDEIGNSLILGNTNFTPPASLSIDIIAGQSNALGQYCHFANIPVAYAGQNTDILQWDFVKSKWAYNFPGINTSGANYLTGAYIDCWGAELPYLYQKQAATSQKIACIKNVKGAIKIDQWAQPSGAMFLELKSAIEDAIASVTTPSFDSILWLQGESDIIGSTPAADYKAALISLINAVRAIHATTANMKWVLVKLPTGMTGLDDTKTAAQNAVLDEIAASLTGIYIVDSNSLTPTFEDSLHFTAATIEDIGDAWYSILNP